MIYQCEEVAAATRDSPPCSNGTPSSTIRGSLLAFREAPPRTRISTTSRGRTTVGHDLYTRNLTINLCSAEETRPLLKVLSLHGSHGTRKVALSRCTISDDHDIGQRLAIGFDFLTFIFSEIASIYLSITDIRSLDSLAAEEESSRRLKLPSKLSNRTASFRLSTIMVSAD